MNQIYTKKFILNMKKAEKSLKSSKGHKVEDFLKLTRKWAAEAKKV